MTHAQLWLRLSITLLCAIALHASQAQGIHENSLKSSVFLSPPFLLQPGSVVDKFYYNIDFPRGHIALKSFNAEVVDEKGVPVPLHETYLHHWVVARYYGQDGAEVSTKASDGKLHLSKFIPVTNSGICKGTLGQYYGLGSETRGTATWVPEPYGIEVGNPVENIPDGYEERWMLNVHAIDTRGVEDRAGCTECKCSLYNVTEDKYGRTLRKDYTGGLYCCYDQTQCLRREGVEIVTRKLYLRYTVKWVDWDETILPVRIYIFDVTDSGKMLNNSTEGKDRPSCKVEYEVKSCNLTGKVNGECVDTKKANLVMPHGGDIVYGVAHQHSGGAGSALYGQDGRVLCTSMPTYGEGREAGNEAGYIVGMSTCYPSPGSVKVLDGEVLTLVSNYSNTQMHTGVMGLFYILVADPQPKAILFTASRFHEVMKLNRYAWGLVFLGVTVAIVVGAVYRRKKNGGEGYQSLVM